jgi:hypothetical protein
MDTPTDDKTALLQQLRDEFAAWEALFARLSEAQLVARQLDGGLSVKDVVAHLWTWQQRSIARLEAAQAGHAPEFPAWPGAADPDDDEHRDINALNAWIFAQSRDKPWAQVHGDWAKGYWRFLELGEAVPEADLLAVGHYAWLPGYALAEVLRGSYNHHHDEHLRPLLAQFGDAAGSAA